jgi:hypothetical protein
LPCSGRAIGGVDATMDGARGAATEAATARGVMAAAAEGDRCSRAWLVGAPETPDDVATASEASGNVEQGGCGNDCPGGEHDVTSGEEGETRGSDAANVASGAGAEAAARRDGATAVTGAASVRRIVGAATADSGCWRTLKSLSSRTGPETADGTVLGAEGPVAGGSAAAC